MIRGVIFDIDNTLYDYDICNYAAEKKLILEISSLAHCSEKKGSTLLAQAKRNVKNRLGDVASAHNRLLYMQNICEQIGINPIFNAMSLYHIYWDAVLDKMTLYEYVRPTFQYLHDRHIKLGVLTDLTAYIQYQKLNVLGIASDVDVIVTSEEVGADKPSGKMFQCIIEKMELSPKDLIMIGDSQSKDIDGALKCGMKGMLYEAGMDVRKEIERLCSC